MAGLGSIFAGDLNSQLGYTGGYSPLDMSGVQDWGSYGGRGINLNNALGSNGLGSSDINSSWFTRNGGFAGLGNLLSGIGQFGAMGLGAYTGLKQLGLANKQLGLAQQDFSFQKSLANRNLANQAKTINNQYDTSAAMYAASANSEKTPAEQEAARQAALAGAKKNYVDGSPIG